LLNNNILGQISVVEGTAVNQAHYPISRILIKGEIVGANSAVLVEQTGYAGNILTDEELANLSEAEILKKLFRPEGRNKSNDRIMPEGKIPFMIVFFREPAGFIKTTVMPISLERIVPASTLPVQAPSVPSPTQPVKEVPPVQAAAPSVKEIPPAPAPLPAPQDVAPAAVEKKPEKVSIILKVKFDDSKHDIKKKYHKSIQRLADFMKAHPETSIEIIGHNNNLGKESVNILLSQKRADSVRKYRINEFGIDKSRIHALGYGANQPIASSKTRQGRQKNQRIEVVIEGIQVK